MASCPRCSATVTAADMRRGRLDEPGSHCPKCGVGLEIEESSWWWLAGACAAVGIVALVIGRTDLGSASGIVVAAVGFGAIPFVWWRVLVTLSPTDAPAASQRRPNGGPGGR